MFSLRNQIAVVTGSSSGIGLACACAFAEAGARVVVTSNEPERCYREADQLRRAGHAAIAVPGDVSRDADLVLGYLGPTSFAGGGIRLDKDAAVAAIAALGNKLDMTVDECAAGICRIVEFKMADIIRRTTVEKGYAPATSCCSPLAAPGLRMLASSRGKQEFVAFYACAHCQAAQGRLGKNYKLQGLSESRPITVANPLIEDPGLHVDSRVTFRSFYCPGCRSLLDNEVVVDDRPPTHDIDICLAGDALSFTEVQPPGQGSERSTKERVP